MASVPFLYSTEHTSTADAPTKRALIIASPFETPPDAAYDNLETLSDAKPIQRRDSYKSVEVPNTSPRPYERVFKLISGVTMRLKSTTPDAPLAYN